MVWWCRSTLLVVLLLLATYACADADVEVEEAEGEEIELDDKDANKAIYVPPKFVAPKISGDVFFIDWFSDRSSIGKKWILSKGKKDDAEDSNAKFNGEWKIDAPSKVIFDGDLGLIVKTRARHHAIAAKFNKPYKFDDKPLVVQYELKYEDGQDCGGGYVKLLTEGAEKKLNEFTDKTPYTIMLGPDKCGPTAKVYFIVRFKNPKSGVVTEHHGKQPSKPLVSYFDDHKTHLYTLIIRPDETFTVMVDRTKIMSGSLLNDLEPSIVPPTVIDDPEDKKPSDWDEREKIDDPDAKKPDDWDESAPRKIEDVNAKKPDDWLEDVEALIPDPESTKPDDWDVSIDGDWEAPKIDNPVCKEVSGCGTWMPLQIDNPSYKGKWKKPRIANPAYKGKWKPQQIENPNYFEPHPFSELQPIAAIGIELWTMSANIIFDDILVVDNEEMAEQFAKDTFTLKVAQEAAYESISSPSQGILEKLVTATEERPWLWAVYVLSVLIPVIIIAVVCFGRKSRPSTSDYKKTDVPQPDDEMPDLVDDDEEDNEDSIDRSSHDEDEKVSIDTNANPKRAASRSPGRKKDNPKRAASRSPGRKKQSNDSQSNDEVKENGDESEPGANQSSPRARRPRQRKQD